MSIKTWPLSTWSKTLQILLVEKPRSSWHSSSLFTDVFKQFYYFISTNDHFYFHSHHSIDFTMVYHFTNNFHIYNSDLCFLVKDVIRFFHQITSFSDVNYVVYNDRNWAFVYFDWHIQNLNFYHFFMQRSSDYYFNKLFDLITLPLWRTNDVSSSSIT